MRVPELEFELEAGTLGGLFTTVEGLLSQARDHLTQANPLSLRLGDAHTGGAQPSAAAATGGGETPPPPRVMSCGSMPRPLRVASLRHVVV
eukprot:COSAG01_NODE_15535_length_1325_cov_1.660962_1_plen_91_part_00